MDKISVPESVTVGTEIGNMNRKIEENMKKYLEGDIAAKEEMLKYSRKRAECLKARKFQKVSHSG
jgi:hypothetical protein